MSGKSTGSLLTGRKVSLFLPPVLWALAIFIVSSIPGDSLPPIEIINADKLAHIAVFSVLGFLTNRAFINIGRRIHSSWIIWFFCVVYGVSDEIHQMFVPGRLPSVLDVAADAIGAGLGVWLWMRWRHWAIKKGKSSFRSSE